MVIIFPGERPYQHFIAVPILSPVSSVAQRSVFFLKYKPSRYNPNFLNQNLCGHNIGLILCTGKTKQFDANQKK
jgi:hypothetical protein